MGCGRCALTRRDQKDRGSGWVCNAGGGLSRGDGIVLDGRKRVE